MIKFCSKCIMPNSRPRIQFNKKQVCNACSNSEKKSKINWQNRKKEFYRVRDLDLVAVRDRIR